MEFPSHSSRMKSHSAWHYTSLKLSLKVLEGEMLVRYTLFGVCVSEKDEREREKESTQVCSWRSEDSA